MAVHSRNELEARIRSFDYWHYPFDLGDGVVINPGAKQKLILRDFIWPATLDLCGGSLEGMRVLDVACNAGFWSLEAHSSGAAYVLGVDARPVHVEQAQLVRDALNVDPARVAFSQMDIYDLSPEEIGEFDLCLVLRILNHLSHPLLALQKLRAVCRSCLVIDIKLFHDDDRPLLSLHREDPSLVLHGVEGLALRPTRAALELMLRGNGFSDVQFVPPTEALEGAYHSGKRAVFTAHVSEPPIGAASER